MSTLSTSSLVSSPRIKCDSLTMLPSNSCAHSPISPSSKLMAMPITKILPFLYLGSSIDACDSEKLKSLHITHVLNVSINLPDPPETLKLKGYKRIPVIDSFTQDIMPHFEEAFNFIGKLFVWPKDVIIASSLSLTLPYRAESISVLHEISHRLVNC